MIYSTPKLVVEQIYNFVAEFDGLDTKSRFMQLSIFFKALHEGVESGFHAHRSLEFQGVFNNIEKSIFANAAPEFFDKKNFLEWVVREIKTEP